MSLSLHNRHAHSEETLGITQSSTLKVQWQSFHFLHHPLPPSKKIKSFHAGRDPLADYHNPNLAKKQEFTKVNGCQCSSKPNLMEKRWSNQSYVR